MKNIDKQILKFLLSASVYSENAIMKNFGITQKELDEVFKRLEIDGYLESYDKFLEREKLNEAECCKTKQTKCCSCSSSHCNSLNDCCSTNPFSQIEDFSKIKILTEKALNEFNY